MSLSSAPCFMLLGSTETSFFIPLSGCWEMHKNTSPPGSKQKVPPGDREYDDDQGQQAIAPHWAQLSLVLVP